MRVSAPMILAALAIAAAAAPGTAAAQAEHATYEYTICASGGEASIVEVVGAPCTDAEAVAAQVVAGPIDEEGAALTAAGWSPLRAQSTAQGGQHDLLATRGTAALRIRRTGAAPDLDGWEAGRELILARKRLVGGKPAPSGAVLCTSSWLVKLAGGGLGGLTAGHCGGLRKDRTVQRYNVGLRRPPQPGIILGRVKRILTRTKPRDALVVPVQRLPNRPALAVIDRGVSRPPWRVVGVGQATAGRAICFSGRTSGIDQCGSIDGSGARGAERILSIFAGVAVRCTTIAADHGDSGGPVFTAPAADGSVYAVGLTTLIVGDSRRMCFTPLAPVLDALDAQLVTG
jgi:hypothetical protein